MSSSPRRTSSFALLVVIAALAVTSARAQTPAPPITPGKTGVIGGVAFSALVAGQMLKPTEFIQSPNKKYSLRFRKDGHLSVLTGGQFIWLSGVTSTAPDHVEVTAEGSIRSIQSNPAVPVYWTIQIWAPGAFLAMLDDGNVVLYHEKLGALWSRNGSVAPFVEVLVPNQVLAPLKPPVIQTSGSSWGTHVPYNGVETYAYVPGEYTSSPNGKHRLIFQANGSLVVSDGTTAIWSTPATTYPPTKANWINGMLDIWENKPGQALHAKIIDTSTTGGKVLAMQDDGTLAVYRVGDMRPVWKSK